MREALDFLIVWNPDCKFYVNFNRSNAYRRIFVIKQISLITTFGSEMIDKYAGIA